ncbi:MAG: manganese efflux pump, partial [Clostridia bacterium]|nr:manganese efflux pump [Clostridia bacterium]
MTVTTLFFLSLALSADAFTVAVCKGLSLPRRSLAAACTVGAWFGLFQGLMPVFGYLVGALFEKTVSAYGHIVSFVLLSVIGLQFIRDARQKNTPESLSASLSPLSVLPLAVATSI